MIEGGESFLVVRLTALGDILHTLPAVAALRAAHKNARIDWVVERKWMPVLEGSPVISEVIPFNRDSGFDALKSALRLRQKNYTCAIDFQGLYKSSVLAMLSSAPRRIGFERGWVREDGAAMGAGTGCGVYCSAGDGAFGGDDRGIRGAAGIEPGAVLSGYVGAVDGGRAAHRGR